MLIRRYRSCRIVDPAHAWAVRGSGGPDSVRGERAPVELARHGWLRGQALARKRGARADDETRSGEPCVAYAPRCSVRQVYITSPSQPPVSANDSTAGREPLAHSGAAVENAEVSPPGSNGRWSSHW